MHLQIVSFDIPYPPNYGGIVDVYFKLKALSKLGIKIIFHCFEYKDNVSTSHLDTLCEKVYYYKRNQIVYSLFSKKPMIVKSREHKDLLQNLNHYKYPILFEGLHCCAFLSHPLLQYHQKFVRMHNNESAYYAILSKQESSLLKRLFFKLESKKLKWFENQLKSTQTIFCITNEDAMYFKVFSQTQYLPAFHPNEEGQFTELKENFILFHGSLDVQENDLTAKYITNEIAKLLPNFKFKIAGKKPSKSLLKQVENKKNIELIANPRIDELQNLISKAQINFVFTKQDTGIKLKLLNTLFNGGFCIANTEAVHETGLSPLCIIADEPYTIVQKIQVYMDSKFSQTEFEYRKNILSKLYNNSTNAQILIQKIFQK